MITQDNDPEPQDKKSWLWAAWLWRKLAREWLADRKAGQT